jgi:hypothetical protein
MKAWRPLRACSGQAMVEYLVACALVVALVAFPIDGYPSVIAEMLALIHKAYTNFLAAMSIPM